MRYADGTAFRKALADCLRRLHPRSGRWPPAEAGCDGALLGRRRGGTPGLGEHLTYRIEATTRGALQGAPYGGGRLTVVAELGGQRFMPFPLDVGLGDADTGAPDVLRGGIDLSFADLAPLDVPAASVAVHVAEKLHALCFPRSDGRESSRVKDLVDVVLLRQAAFADVEAVPRAVAATFERRGTHELPARNEVPMRSWAREYRKLATDLQLDPAANTVERGVDILDDLVRAIGRVGES